MHISKQDIEKIAKLARVNLSDEEKAVYQNEISNILTWIEQLQNVDVSHISLADLVPKDQMKEREDVISVHNDLNDVLGNAPKTSFDMFAVPKMVE